MLNQFIALVAVFGAACAIGMPVASIESPGGKVGVSFSIEEGQLFYSVEQNGVPMIGKSKLEIFQGLEAKVTGQSITESDSSWNPVYGQFSEIRDHHRELRLDVDMGGIPVTLLCRAYDEGVGLRFVSDHPAKRDLTFLCEFNLEANDDLYFPRGENEPVGPVKLAGQKRLVIPVVVERTGGKYMAILESDLYSAEGFDAIKLSHKAGVLVSTGTGSSQATSVLTPWRVVLFGDSPGDLLLNCIPLNLAAPCELADTSWIKPGTGLWDWRIHGYHNGTFEYGINTRSYLHLIDFCAEQGLEYLTIDDFWFTRATEGRMTVAPEVDIAKVMQYAKDKGIDIILYYDRKKGNFGDQHLYAHYSSLGASGIKYGFMGNKAAFTRGANKGAAEEELLTNYHDGPVPMTGVCRTLPNAITREYCHAQQDSRRAFSPQSFLKMAMINALTGPLDQANGNFGINSINAGERKKGPKKKNSYVTTVTSEIARTLVIYSSLITLPDAPEEYLKKADLFEFLKQMPATWDESLILNSAMSKYITTARRSGDTWFVGSVNNEEPRALQVKLDFLQPGFVYEATIFQDGADARSGKNPESYEVLKQTVRQGERLTAKMAKGGGHAILIWPIPTQGQ